MNDLTDKELITIIKSDEDDVWEDAYRKLVSRYRRKVYSQCLYKTHNSHDAEDLTQKVFINVLTGIECYKEQGEFERWISVITRNVINNHFTTPAVRRFDAVDPSDLEGHAASDDAAPAGFLTAELAPYLPDLHRRILELLLQNRPNKEIAAELNRSEGRVSQLVDELIIKSRVILRDRDCL